MIEVDEDTTHVHARGHLDAGRDGHDRDAGARGPYRVTADVATARGSPTWTSGAAATSSTITALDPETGKRSEDTAKVFITVPFLVIEAPTLDGRVAGGGGQVRERRDPGRRARPRTPTTVAVIAPSNVGPSRASPASRWRPPVAPGARPSARRPSRWATTARSSAPLELSAGKWQITVTATSTEGKTTTLTRNVAIVLQGRQPRRVASRAAAPGSRSGSTARSTGHRERAARSSTRARCSRSPASGPIEVRTGKSGATYFTLNGKDIGRMLGRSASPRRGCSRPPARPRRPVAPDVAADPLVELAERLQARCSARGLTVATGESCTGGLVGHRAHRGPGSSAYVRGGIVAYANEVKTALLGVPAEVLEAHGAVSAQVAVAMAKGARDAAGHGSGRRA